MTARIAYGGKMTGVQKLVSLMLLLLLAAGGAPSCAGREREEGRETKEKAEAAPAAEEKVPEKTAGQGPEKTTEKPEKPEWERPRFTERQAERDLMVKTQMRDVKDEKVLEAMKNVPRHKFVPKYHQGSAYSDRPLSIGHGQTISQPYIVAYMTEALKLKPEHKVLEIGTGSAYQAAILGEITPHVYSIEIVKPLAESAKKRLKDLGYKTVKTIYADGYHGWKKHAPFDAIIVTCAATHVPPPLFAQLKEGGRMCIPVGGRFSFQELLVVEKKDGKALSRSVMGVVFVPLTRWKKGRGGK
jgi:protein-L-isoaspartate(D-aspartate) O-methyltransferase